MAKFSPILRKSLWLLLKLYSCFVAPFYAQDENSGVLGKKNAPYNAFGEAVVAEGDILHVEDRVDEFSPHKKIPDKNLP